MPGINCTNQQSTSHAPLVVIFLLQELERPRAAPLARPAALARAKE